MKKLLKNNNMVKQSYKIRSQNGLSMIELLISVLIGLFLLSGVITNFIGTKDSDRTRAAISEMDANARTALSVMRQSIMHAGYPSIYNQRLEKAFYTESDGDSLTNPVCSDDSTLRDSSEATPGSDQQTRDRSRGDVITIVTLADNPCVAGQANCPNADDVNSEALVYSDCMGGGATRESNRVVSCSAEPGVGMGDGTEAKIYSTFRLGGGSNSRTLYCDGNRGGTQPLVDNIEAMQFLYGIRLDDGTVTYRKADDVDDDDQWGMVKSVQVALLMRSSQQNILKVESTKEKYTLLDKVWEITEKRRLYRVYTTTINLENLNKGALL